MQCQTLLFPTRYMYPIILDLNIHLRGKMCGDKSENYKRWKIFLPASIIPQTVAKRGPDDGERHTPQVYVYTPIQITYDTILYAHTLQEMKLRRDLSNTSKMLALSVHWSPRDSCQLRYSVRLSIDLPVVCIVRSIPTQVRLVSPLLNSKKDVRVYDGMQKHRYSGPIMTGVIPDAVASGLPKLHKIVNCEHDHAQRAVFSNFCSRNSKVDYGNTGRRGRT
jgi:hypothetical protein